MEPMDTETIRTTQSKKRKLNPVAAKIPKSIKSYVSKRLTNNAEMKYHDVVVNNTASSASFLAQNLLDVPQGTTETNRIGDKIRVHRVKWQISCQPGDNYNLCRFMISANTTRTQVSTTSLIGALYTTPPTDNADPMWVDQFLYPCYLAADGAAGTAMRPITLKGDRKVNWVIHYPTAATQAPMNRNFFYQFHSDSAVVPHPGLQGWFRVYFTDA